MRVEVNFRHLDFAKFKKASSPKEITENVMPHKTEDASIIPNQQKTTLPPAPPIDLGSAPQNRPSEILQPPGFPSATQPQEAQFGIPVPTWPPETPHSVSTIPVAPTDISQVALPPTPSTTPIFHVPLEPVEKVQTPVPLTEEELLKSIAELEREREVPDPPLPQFLPPRDPIDLVAAKAAAEKLTRDQKRARHEAACVELKDSQMWKKASRDVRKAMWPFCNKYWGALDPGWTQTKGIRELMLRDAKWRTARIDGSGNKTKEKKSRKLEPVLLQTQESGELIANELARSDLPSTWFPGSSSDLYRYANKYGAAFLVPVGLYEDGDVCQQWVDFDGKETDLTNLFRYVGFTAALVAELNGPVILSALNPGHLADWNAPSGFRPGFGAETKWIGGKPNKDYRNFPPCRTSFAGQKECVDNHMKMYGDRARYYVAIPAGRGAWHIPVSQECWHAVWNVDPKSIMVSQGNKLFIRSFPLVTGAPKAKDERQVLLRQEEAAQAAE